jgi:cellulose synthase/poly-beta-1,6-N-acetylglucosamine synthase-like glycosyltransferase
MSTHRRLEIVFWASLFFVSYVYVGYPLLVAAWSRLARRSILRGEWEPTVSLMIAAHNEADVLRAKVENCRSLDYPSDRLQIVLSIDGSTDGTDEVARQLAADDVVVLCSARHRGKAAALNRAVEAASGEILVFCDARQRLEREALRELVADLRDPAVGAVSGELLLLDDKDHEAGDGVGLYWRYEKSLRSMESSIHSTLGATGALYAVRRELFSPIPEGAILDDVIVPMKVVLAGLRTIFEPRARALDRVCPPEVEFQRKVRTLAGNFQLLALMPELLRPWRNPVFVQFLSHKVGRLLVPWFLVLLLASNLLLLDGVYLLFLVGQLTFYLLALGGVLARRVERPLTGVAPPLKGALKGRQP